MRAYILIALLSLPACGRTPDDPSSDRQSSDNRPEIVANILDAAVPNAHPPSPPDTAITPTEPDSNRSGNRSADRPASRVDAASDAIPALFLGRWTGAADACADRSADLELTVTATQLIFHESVGTVRALRSAPDGRLSVDAAFTGEGQSWTRTLALTPSADGRRLTIVNDGAAVTRKRCA